jgi:anti-anti-sigma factor
MQTTWKAFLEPRSDDESAIRVVGDFDIRSADDVASVVRQAEAAAGQRIVFELDDVTFMDSVALAVLIGARERARVRDGQVVVRAERGPARDLLGLVGLTELLEDPARAGDGR